MSISNGHRNIPDTVLKPDPDLQRKPYLPREQPCDDLQPTLLHTLLGTAGLEDGECSEQLANAGPNEKMI